MILLKSFEKPIIVKTQYPHFNTVFNGFKKGLYLMQYHDKYLKDVFVTQLAESFIDRQTSVIFAQEEVMEYSLKDLFRVRLLFKENPHQSPGLKVINQRNNDLHFFTSKNKSCYYSKSRFFDTTAMHPYYMITEINNFLEANPSNHILIVDVNQKYFRTNLLPQLDRLAFRNNLPIIVTSKISPSDPDENISLPPHTAFYLHSKQTNLYSLSNSKETAYEFELDVDQGFRKQEKIHFTLRPAYAYCQEG